MEILIWGDNMKRQIGISVFLSLLLVTLSLIYIKINNETKPKENEIATETESEKTIEISQEYTVYMFYAKEEYGKLVIYHVNNQEIYMETGIEIATLPEEIRQNLDTGIYFETEKELYDFLESYSS